MAMGTLMRSRSQNLIDCWKTDSSFGSFFGSLRSDAKREISFRDASFCYDFETRHTTIISRVPTRSKGGSSFVTVASHSQSVFLSFDLLSFIHRSWTSHSFCILFCVVTKKSHTPILNHDWSKRSSSNSILVVRKQQPQPQPQQAEPTTRTTTTTPPQQHIQHINIPNHASPPSTTTRTTTRTTTAKDYY